MQLLLWYAATLLTRLETLSRDSLYALRTLRKNPTFSCVAVLTLALGIGANTAIFSVIHAVLLKPLQYRDPDRLVNISGGSTPRRFEAIKSTAHSFTDVTAFTTPENVTLSTKAQPEILKAVRVSANFLDTLEVVPLIGRSFLPEEDSPGSAGVVMISAEFWQRRFDQDPHAIGKTMMLAATPYTIIGVLPANFQFPLPGLDVWSPRPAEWPSMPPKSRPMSPFLNIIGRLKPGISLDQAGAEMAVIQHQYALAHPTMLDARPKSPAGVRPMKEQLVTNIRSVLWILFGTVGFVLVIACANVASLLMARASVRAREFAVRSALGASRGRLLAQLLTESVLLAVGGGALGLLFAVSSLRVVRGITSFDLPRASEIHVDWAVLGFAIAVSFVTGLVFGLIPALGASRPDISAGLGAKGDVVNASKVQRTRMGFTTRGVLVIVQVALSVVLLIGAALLLETVLRLRADNPGFNPAHLLTMRVSLPPSRYETDEKRNTFFDELIRRMQPLPGVRGATAALSLPMTSFPGTPVQDASKPVLKLNERPIATLLIVSPGYFNTLQIPFKRGRKFTDHDRHDTQRVAIIDEGLARQFWPAYPAGQDPVGQHLLVGGINLQPVQIIGIAANVHQNVENDTWPMSVYAPFAQYAPPSAMLAIRTEGDPLRMTNTIRMQVQALDRDLPVSDVHSMQELIETELGQRSLLVKLLGSFAGAALLLALVGIYGVIAYSVTQRTYELGIRRALGARDGHILWLILAQAFGLALVGTAIGIAGSFALTRVMKTLLVHVSTTDPATFVSVAVLFVTIAVIAGYIPARRATRMDPMAAFRYE